MTDVKKTNIVNSFRYPNETYSGCDCVAAITVAYPNEDGGQSKYTRALGEIQTISYSINMAKTPVRSIGNVNAKDYVMGPRTIAGSLVFSVFHRHFAQEIMAKINGGEHAGTAYLVDEIPPFDITLSFANEYGFRSRLVIYGVRLLNEGQVMSINDIYTENTYQFLATDVQYLTDEVKISNLGKTGPLYKINDNIAVYKKKAEDAIKNPILYQDKDKINKYWDAINSMSIKLSVSIKQPKAYGVKGIVDFFVEPLQDEGTIYITNEENEVTTITLKANKVDPTETQGKENKWYKNNKVGYASIKLPYGTYTAVFENNKKKKSNTVKFKIDQIIKKNPLDSYAPVVDYLTHTSCLVYSNEPLHDKVKIFVTGVSNKPNNYMIFDIKKNRIANIENLIPNTKYTVTTFKENENIESRPTIFKTLGAKDTMFKRLELFIYSNSSKLLFKDNMDIYLDMLKEIKKEAENNNYDVTKAIEKVKDHFIYLRKLVDKSKPGFQDLLDEYDLKIKICSEILALSNKVFNDLISVVNKESLPMPVKFYDDNYDSNFSFSEETKKAEFFRMYKNLERISQRVDSYIFKKIKNHDNSFRYIDRQGINHYVQAVKVNVRSPKLKFYLMTEAEKAQYALKDNERSKITPEEEEKIYNRISKDFNESLSNSELIKAFMINAKKINYPKLAPLTIESIGEYVTVKSNVKDIIYNDFKKKLYVAIADSENIKNDDMIYKNEFSTSDISIVLDPMLNNLKANMDYALWIEDEDYNQISNPSTFTFSKDSETSSMIKEYELKDIIDTIEKAAETNLPTQSAENIINNIENNDAINSSNIINKTLELLFTQPLTKNNLINFLRAISKYIGLFLDSDDSLIYNIDYDNNNCYFESNKEGTILRYFLSNNEIKTNTQLLSETNTIDYSSDYGNIMLIVCTDKSCNFKSNLILINNSEKYMEVI